jgi:hypothetical protein
MTMSFVAKRIKLQKCFLLLGIKQNIFVDKNDNVTSRDLKKKSSKQEKISI